MLKIVLFVTLVASLFLCSSGAALTPWKEIFSMDCNGGIHVLDSSIPSGFQVGGITSLMNFAVSKIREMVSCKCSSSQLSEAEFQRRFVPGVTAALNMFRGNNHVVDTTCPLNKFARSFQDVNFLEFGLPSSCTLEQWLSGNPCYLQYNVPSVQISLQLAVDRCPNSELPFVSLTCGGDGCQNFMKPCTYNGECGSLKCYSAHNSTINSLLSDVTSFMRTMKFYGTGETPCYSASNTIDYASKFVYSFFSDATPSAPFTDFKVCGLNTDSYANIAADFNCSITSTPISDACSLSNEYVKFNCPNIAPWNGALTGSTTAVDANRKSGTAFTTVMTTGAGTSDTVSIGTRTCNGVTTWFGSEKYGISFATNTAKFTSAFVNLVKLTQDCRSSALSLTQFRAAWELWNLDFWGYLLTSPRQASPTTLTSLLDLINVTAISKRMTLPSTCTLANWQQNGECAVQWSGLKDLLQLDVTIRAKFRRCANEDAPEFVVDCVGADCARLARPTFCNADTDCSSGLLCKNLMKDVNTTISGFSPLGLMLWGVDKNTSAACPNKKSDAIPATETCSPDNEYLLKMVRDATALLTGRAVPTTVTSGLRMCMFDYDAVAKNADDWAKNMVINNGVEFTLRGLFDYSNAWSTSAATTTTTTTTGSSTALVVAAVTIVVAGTCADSSASIIIQALKTNFGVSDSAISCTNTITAKRTVAAAAAAYKASLSTPLSTDEANYKLKTTTDKLQQQGVTTVSTSLATSSSPTTTTTTASVKTSPAVSVVFGGSVVALMMMMMTTMMSVVFGLLLL